MMNRLRALLVAAVGCGFVGHGGALHAQDLQTAPLNPEFVDYMAKRAAGVLAPVEEGENAFGYVPPPVSVTDWMGEDHGRVATGVDLPFLIRSPSPRTRVAG